MDEKRNYILDEDGRFRLLGSRLFLEKLLEYFNNKAKVRFITDKCESKVFFDFTKIKLDL